MSQPSSVENLNPTLPIDQSIYEVETTQKAPLGTRLNLGDRVYYYAQASASVAAGTVLCAGAPTASHQSGIFAIAAASADAKVISGTSSAAVTANYYAEGHFGAALGAGAGQIYRIKSHPAGSAAIPFTLYDGVAQALTSGVGFFLYPNPYKNVFVASQNLGIPVVIAPVNVTSGGYFWGQSWGPANPIHEAASAAGASLRVGTTGGVLAVFNATTNDATTVSALPIAKNSPLAATANQNNPVFLMIRP